MVVVPCSLLRTVQTHAPTQAAITERRGAEISTFGEIAQRALRFRRTLAQLGIEQGDVVRSDLDSGCDLAALILASLATGICLVIGTGTARHAAAPTKLLVVGDRGAPPDGRIRQVSVTELGHSAAAWSLPEPTGNPAAATISVETASGTETMDAETLAKSIENFSAAYPGMAASCLLSASAQLCLDTILISMLVPLALGIHVIRAGDAVSDAAWLAQASAGADWCEFGAAELDQLLATSSLPSMPASVRAVFCRSGRLGPCDLARAEAALGRPLQYGYGTVRTGFWAVCLPGIEGGRSRFTAGIREMRSPLRLIDAGPDAVAGEIMLKPLSDAAETKTGDVGWMTPAGRLEVVGKLSDVSVHGGRAFLLCDIDRLLAGHPDIHASHSFREQGVSPTEPVIAVCATTLTETEVRSWLAERADPAMVPNRIVTLPPSPAGLPPVETLRAAVTGRAGQAMTSALTARRFRRNPAYDEAGLMATVDAALLSDGTLNFLMFWGCGPRRTAAAPDRAAVDALGDLLAAAEAAAPVRARAHVICTDLHATNNGHSESHFLTYFSEIRSLAAGLDATFELESAVWRRGGLTRAAVSALEQEPAFQARWQEFRLRDRFVQQASRHSGLADKTAAARHYYATCLLERDVLKALFGSSIFLTYNGPEFNECFPDLPTLYVYPGPRGRNDKPWFVEVETQVAAE